VKKWLLCVPIILSLAIADAGSLRYSPEFFKQIWANSGSDEILCSNNLIFSKQEDYLCAKTIYRPDLFMTIWDSTAKNIAKNTKQEIQTSTWAEINKNTLYKTSFVLDSVPMVLFVYENFDEPLTTKVIVAAKTGAYRIDPTANPLTNRTTIVQTTTTPNSQITITVQRYLCQPSENGRARVFGTIKNVSTRTLEFLRFNVEFFDGTKFVGQESGYVRADKLTPNSESTFEAIARTPSYTRCEISFEDSTGKLPIKLP
jgi:hypothetical protein